MKRVAVLMSTYNGEKYLREQIDSILSQECEYQVDLIIRDDGSTDNTLEIIKSYGKRIKWYIDINVGAGLSFLKLMYDNPGYDYYAFSDQDDYWENKKIQAAIDCIKNKDGCAMYCSNALMCDVELNSLGRYVHRNMKHFNIERAFFGLCCAQGCTCLLNSEFAEVICSTALPERIVLHDSYLTCLCFAVNGYFYTDDASYMKYRMHGNNVGGLKTKEQSSKQDMIQKRVKYISSKPKVSVMDQLAIIKTKYSNYISKEKMLIMDDIIYSKNNVLKRIGYSCKRCLKDESLNLSISNRMKIILGNY